MEIYTISFTKKTAAKFFGLLKSAGITRLIDTRLNNVSQLAGFAKQDDLKYFLKEICGAEYVHETSLAPTQEMLDGFKKQKGSWSEYEAQFLSLLRDRQVERNLSKELFNGRAVLLCSEDKPDNCHRRLVAEYLAKHWPAVTVSHLK